MIWSLFLFLCSMYGKDFVLAMVTSTIFYLIVVYFPGKKANKNTKIFIQEYYRTCRKEILDLICSELKIRTNYNEMIQNLLDYEYIRQCVSDGDMEKFKTFSDKQLKEVAVEINYSLNKLQNHISYELSQNYIRENEVANKRLRHLSNWIEQFNHSMINIVDQEYCKVFILFIDEHVRGIDQASGPKKHDDFEDYIENAYQCSLISMQMIHCVKKPFCYLCKFLK